MKNNKKIMEKFIEILSELIKYKTVARNTEECQKCADYLRSILREFGYKVDVVKIGNMNPVIFAEIEGESNTSLIFYDHYDVQPAEPLEEWKIAKDNETIKLNPFELARIGDKLYGRGVADNKGNIVSRILAVWSILEEKGKLPCTIKFVIEGEEEAGSPNLKKALDEKRKFFENCMGVIWEFGGFNKDNTINLILGLKGIVYAEIRSERLSRDAHSSLACVLPSATWDLIEFLVELRNTIKTSKKFFEGIIDAKKIIEDIRNSGFSIYFDSETLKEVYNISKFYSSLHGELSDTEALYHYYGSPTINIDGFLAGYTEKGPKTVLPREALAKIDFRLVPFQKPTNVMDIVKTLAEKRNLSVKFFSSTEPTYTDFKNPFVQFIIKVLNKIHQDFYIEPWSPGSGPMHLFTNYLKLPCVAGIGVAYWDSRGHAPNENIRIKDVEKAIELIREIILSAPAGI